MCNMAVPKEDVGDIVDQPINLVNGVIQRHMTNRAFKNVLQMKIANALIKYVGIDVVYFKYITA